MINPDTQQDNDDLNYDTKHYGNYLIKTTKKNKVIEIIKTY